MREITESDVKKYYNKNTKWFLRLGAQKQSRHIHQALWAEGVTCLDEALLHGPSLVLQELSHNDEPQTEILDLGCGVGGTLQFLADQTPSTVLLTGITISRAQQKIATSSLTHRGLAKRCQVIEGSFQNLPPSLPPIDLAYAIEAFVHSPDAGQFFQQVSKVLKTGGKLVLIDDFLSTSKIPGVQGRKTIQTFKAGWHLGSLLSPESVIALAKNNRLQLIENQDLTPLLDLNRTRDRLLHFYVRLMRPLLKSSTYFQSLLGGDARYSCLIDDWIHYRKLVFEKD